VKKRGVSARPENGMGEKSQEGKYCDITLFITGGKFDLLDLGDVSSGWGTPKGEPTRSPQTR